MEIKKRKVAFLVSHPVQYLSPLFTKLAAHPKIDLTVLYCSSEGLERMTDEDFSEDIKWDIPLLEGYRYKFLKNFSPEPSIFRTYFGLINFGIVRELSGGGYDILIVHGWHYFTYWLAFLTAFFHGISIYLRSESPLNQELLKPKWKTMVKKIVLGPLFNIATGFLAIGTENIGFYRFYGVGKDKIFLVPYAVDNDRFIASYERLKTEKKSLRNKNGIPVDKTIVLFCGKLIKKKRPMDLLKAYHAVMNDKKTLLFVGDGKLRTEMESYVKSNGLRHVYFAGFKNQTEIAEYYALSDILVLPSGMGETWGLVINEAMCFSLPVIVSDMVGCGKDLVKHGENGFVFRQGAISELAGFIDIILTDPNERIKMSLASSKIIARYNYGADVSGIIEAVSIGKTK